MSKKNFTGGVSSLLGETPEKKKVGRPQSPDSNEEGLPKGHTRATFVISEALLNEVKAIAYWERLTIKEVVNGALQDAVDKYAKVNGSLPPMPKK